jgi:hypothetical protein
MRGKPLTAVALPAGSALMMWSSGAFAQPSMSAHAPQLHAYLVQRLLPFPPRVG